MGGSPRRWDTSQYGMARLRGSILPGEEIQVNANDRLKTTDTVIVHRSISKVSKWLDIFAFDSEPIVITLKAKWAKR
ncbi:hypothetical protein DPEC_G00263430, partial [Dallia pectoralis]